MPNNKIFNIDHMTRSENKYIFYIAEQVKQSCVGQHIKPLELLWYISDDKICVVSHLDEYIQRTANLRKYHKQLIISFLKPHSPVSKDSVSRRIRSLLLSAGIDTTKLTAPEQLLLIWQAEMLVYKTL